MILKTDFENMHENRLISEETIGRLKQFSTIVLWGTAGAANFAEKFLRSQHLKLNFVTDSFHHRENESWNDIPFLNKEDLFLMKSSVIVVIACSYGYKIDKLLDEHAIPYVTFDTNLHDTDIISGISQCANAKEQILNSFGAIERVFQMLQDEKSRKTLYNVLSYRITLNRSLIQSVYDPNLYFGNDVLQSFSGNTVIDCGAYVGDTVKSFFDHGFSCKQYLALEPSPAQFKELNSSIKKYPNVQTLPIAAWDCKETLNFTQNLGGGNHIGQNGSLSIQADKIDDITKDYKVDLIKMDIEGAEIPALKGANHVIQSDHPIIIASIYHHLTDFWEIPLLIKKMHSNYKIYIRHHSLWGDDTVLYAVS